MTQPILTAIDRLSKERHQWLFEAGEQIRRWREEDERNGISWESTRDGGGDRNSPPVNNGD
jgi:hypothetical protein